MARWMTPEEKAMAKKMAAKKTKAVPEAGETERLRIVFPEDFWRKFWAGCFVASGIRSSELAIEYADDLAKRFREGK